MLVLFITRTVENGTDFRLLLRTFVDDLMIVSWPQTHMYSLHFHITIELNAMFPIRCPRRARETARVAKVWIQFVANTK